RGRRHRVRHPPDLRHAARGVPGGRPPAARTGRARTAPVRFEGDGVTVLVGFVPTAEGEAAFAAGLAEARRRGENLLVLNSPRDGAPVSADVAPPEVASSLTDRAESAGVSMRLVQEARRGDLADEVLHAADDADASVI